MRILALLMTALTGATPASSTVSVAYAASLVRVMEGPIAQTLQAKSAMHFSGEPKGSKALAQLIAAGLRTPDVFISADTSLYRPLLAGSAPRISGYAVFGSARLLVAYSPQSRYRALFEEAAAGRRSLLDVLSTAGVRTGRTDPAEDPKGERTIRAIGLLGAYSHDAARAQAVLANSPVFPEEDLAVRVQTGELDAGFFYSTEVPGRGYGIVELPAEANLSHEIRYGIAILRDAPHPQAARAFTEFILHGAGRAILERAGVVYSPRPEITGTL